MIMNGNKDLISHPVSGSSIINKHNPRALGDAVGTSSRFYLTESDEYFVKMKTTFRVPSIPKDITGNYFLYLWPGVQSAKGGVLQPVLAFHNTYKSWYLHTFAISPDDMVPYQKGDDYDVPVGIDLTGVIELIDNNDNGLTYKVYFEGYPENTSCEQTWNHSTPPVYAYDIIEPWYVSNAEQFPQEGFLVMRDIELFTNKGKLHEVKWLSDNPEIITCASDKVVIPYWNGLAS